MHIQTQFFSLFPNKIFICYLYLLSFINSCPNKFSNPLISQSNINFPLKTDLTQMSFLINKRFTQQVFKLYINIFERNSSIIFFLIKLMWLNHSKFGICKILVCCDSKHYLILTDKRRNWQSRRFIFLRSLITDLILLISILYNRIKCNEAVNIWVTSCR